MENEILDLVLKDAPSFWVTELQSAYNNSYKLYDVPERTGEYDLVKNSFYEYACNIQDIRRIQNPYQLGLFRIMKEKRKSEGGDTTIVSVIATEFLHSN